MVAVEKKGRGTQAASRLVNRKTVSAISSAELKTDGTTQEKKTRGEGRRVKERKHIHERKPETSSKKRAPGKLI